MPTAPRITTRPDTRRPAITIFELDGARLGSADQLHQGDDEYLVEIRGRIIMEGWYTFAEAEALMRQEATAGNATAGLDTVPAKVAYA